MNIWWVQHKPQKTTRESALQQLRVEPGIRYAEPIRNRVTLRRSIPNDPFFPEQWGLRNAGQTGGTAGADISAAYAWQITRGDNWGNHVPVVAVIDNGFQQDHPDLAFLSGGYNAYADNFDVPVANHGTHVTGILGATSNNNTGVSGVMWGTEVFPVAGSSGSEIVVVRAYEHILGLRQQYNSSGGTSGRFIVATNSSFGVDEGDPANFPYWCAMYDAMGAAGILSVAATANKDWDIDQVGDVPTACNSNYLITVTNTTHLDNKYAHPDLDKGAAWGLNTIHLGAPGTNIRSTLTLGSGSYGYDTGTSMATPHVTGVAGLIYSVLSTVDIANSLSNPGPLALSVKDFILNNVDPIAGLSGITTTGGRLNAYEAVKHALPYQYNSVNLSSSVTLPGSAHIFGTSGLSATVTIPAGRVAVISGTVNGTANARLRVFGRVIIEDQAILNQVAIEVEDGGELIVREDAVFSDVDMEIAIGGQMQVQPGVQFAFGTGQGLVVHGRLLVNGSPANRVEFTSSGSNSWEGIELSHGSSSETSELNWCEVSNASIGIRSNTHNSTPIITNCIIEDNQVGIRIAEFFKGGFPEMMVYGNTIQNNNTGLSVQYSSSLGMEGNEFHDNGNGVYLSNSSTVLIQHNLFDGHSTALSSYSSGSQVLRNKMLSNSNSGLSLGFSSVSTANENDIYPGNYAVSTFYSTVHAGATANYGANYWGMSPVHAMFHEGLGSQILDYFPPAPSPWNNWNQFQMAPESGSQEEVLVQVRTNSSPATAAADQRQPMFESNCDDAGAAMTSQTNWPHNHEAQLMELAGCYLYNEKVGFPEFLASEVKSRVSETDRAYGSALNLESIFHIRDRQYEKAHDNYVRINELFSDEPGLHKLALASLVYLYFEHLENHGEAARYFGELQTRYPDSETTFQLAGIYGRQLEGGSREDREQAESGTPMANELQSNYPNPFNPTTQITYKLSEPAQVHLTVYDMLGRRVAELVNGPVEAGSHTAAFDGSRLASGVYMYRLQSGGQVLTGKMMLVK